MSCDEKFFEIKELRTKGGTRANIVLLEVENTRGKVPHEKAYLAFCEELQPMIDGKINELEGDQLLVLTGIGIGIIYHEGTPVLAPRNWKTRVIKPLEIHNPLMLVIEETSQLAVEDALTFA